MTTLEKFIDALIKGDVEGMIRNCPDFDRLIEEKRKDE